MKTKTITTRWPIWVLLLSASLLGPSCMTTYDAYGRPVQSVDPGAATVGIAAAGLAGYAIGNSRSHNDDHHRGYYRRGYYRRGYDRGYDRSGYYYR